MLESTLNNLERVLFYYGLKPLTIQQHGKRFQVFTEDKVYSLKKVATEDRLRCTLQTQNKLLSLSLNILPLLTTTEGLQYATVDGETYYVTPWLEETPLSNDRKGDMLIDYLSYMHQATVELEPIENIKKIDEGLELMKRHWQERLDWLATFIYRADHRIYPSPFEQLVVAHYAIFIQKTHHAMKRLEVWREHAKKSSMQRLVYCIGKSDPSHFIFSAGRLMAVNMEHGGIDTPLKDLATMFDSPHFCIRDWVRAFNLYETTFPLRRIEKELLISFLHYPGSIFETVKAYESAKSVDREWSFVEQFERVHHQEPQREALIQALEAKKYDDDQHDHSS